jgi:hypothetical protein
MKDAFLTKFVGQAIVHHHVRDELSKSKQDVGLVFVVIEQNKDSVDGLGITNGPQMFGPLVQENLHRAGLLDVVFLVFKRLLLQNYFGYLALGESQ